MSNDDSEVSDSEPTDLEPAAVLVEPAPPPIIENNNDWSGEGLSYLNDFCDQHHITRGNPFAIWLEFEDHKDSHYYFKDMAKRYK